MDDYATKLEFGALLELIAGKARTDRGKALLLASAPYGDPRDLEDALEDLREASAHFVSFGRLPIEAASDLSPLLERAQKGGSLDPTGLERVAGAILTAEAIRKELAKKADAFPRLAARASYIPSLGYLEKGIHRVIAPDLSIYDGASPTLRSIRGKIRQMEAKMKKKLGEVVSQNAPYLSEASLTLRNGHYVLPVSIAHKRQVKGLIQGLSGSGGTAFIEPEAIVLLNNEMTELKERERNEVIRLLRELTASIAAKRDELEEINAAIGLFDSLDAKASYLAETDGSVPSLSKEPVLEFLSARHPLIPKDKVVPNDFHLDEKRRIIVLSGPNAGGKTVAIKTLGLLTLSALSGLPVTAKDGALAFPLKSVRADIGDNQSLTDNLSTFSAHLSALSKILAGLGGKDLVLLDELGTGTSPREGEAIAYGVLRYLARKRAFAVVSSHFEGLKAYALKEEGVTNASMLFDKEALRPTYRMEVGLPGESYGLALAKRYDLPPEVISDAEGRLEGGDDASVSEAIRRLSESAAQNLRLREELEKMKAALEKTRVDLAKRERALSAKEARFNEDLTAEKERLLAIYEGKLEEIMHELQEGEGKLHEVISARRRLSELGEKEEAPSFSGPLEVGDYVQAPALYVEGRLTAVSGSKATLITPEGLTVHAKTSQLVKSPAPKRDDKDARSLGVSPDEVASLPSVSTELNLIGLRYEEARLALEKYLDSCLLRGYDRVRIIHGWGSGALRKMVRLYASEHPDIVASFEGAQGEEGGGGATILHLKR